MRASQINPLTLVGSPVLLRELRVSGRKRGTYLLRALAALGALAIASIGYFAILGELKEGGGTSASDLQSLQALAPGVTTALVWTAYAGVMLIAPLLSAPSICDEKRARTLSAMATSPLGAAEIVVGHFLARFVQLAIIVLAPMPMLLGLRAFGGVPAEFVLGCEAVLLSLGALGIALGVLGSVGAKRSITAFFGAVAMLGLLVFFPLMWLFAATEAPQYVPQPPKVVWMAAAPWVLGHLSADLMGGSIPFIAGSPRETWIGAVVVHWGLVVVALLVASFRFRGVVRVEAAGGEDVAAETDKRVGRRRVQRWFRAGGRWLVWALLLGCPALAVIGVYDDVNRGAALFALLVLAGVLAGRVAIVLHGRAAAKRDLAVWDRSVLWRELRQPLISSTKWLVNIGAAGAALLAMISVSGDFGQDDMMFPIGIMLLLAHSALCGVVTPVSIATEREARTWDALLTSPRRPGEILFAKAAGGLRRLWPAPLAVLITGLISYGADGISLVTLGFMLLIMAAPALFLTGTGLVCAVVCRKSVPAIAMNLAIGLTVWLVLPMGTVLMGELFGFDTDAMAVTNPVYLFVTALEGGSDGSYRFEWIGSGGTALAAMVYGTFTLAYALLGAGSFFLAVLLFKRFGGRTD